MDYGSAVLEKELITNIISILNSVYYHPEIINIQRKDERTFEKFFSCNPQPNGTANSELVSPVQLAETF